MIPTTHRLLNRQTKTRPHSSQKNRRMRLSTPILQPQHPRPRTPCLPMSTPMPVPRLFSRAPCLPPCLFIGHARTSCFPPCLPMSTPMSAPVPRLFFRTACRTPCLPMSTPMSTPVPRLFIGHARTSCLPMSTPMPTPTPVPRLFFRTPCFPPCLPMSTPAPRLFFRTPCLPMSTPTPVPRLFFRTACLPTSTPTPRLFIGHANKRTSKTGRPKTHRQTGPL